MAPIYWIMAFVLIGIIFWRANKSNREQADIRERLEVAAGLMEENHHLRSTLAQMSMDIHVLKTGRPASGLRYGRGATLLRQRL